MNDFLAHILVVDDDDGIRSLVKKYLNENKYLVTVANSSEDASEKIKIIKFDLVILDIMMPGKSGLEFIKENKIELDTPIILLTAKGLTDERVEGLEVGADDYLVKPFGLRELVARCRALLRRARQNSSGLQDTYNHDNLCLYINECRVTRDGVELNLSPKEYKILELFIQNPKRVWSRDQLLEKIWGIDFVGDTKTVDVHIRWLREKIEAQPSAPELIRTVRGFGYRFG